MAAAAALDNPITWTKTYRLTGKVGALLVCALLGRVDTLHSRCDPRSRIRQVQLTAEEAVTYAAAADRLHEPCEITLDLGQPVASDEWILILAAHAALQGDVAVLDDVIATLQTGIRGRKQEV